MQQSRRSFPEMTGQLGYHAGPEVDPQRVRWRIPQQENATAVVPPHTLHANIHMWIYDTYKIYDTHKSSATELG